MFILSADSSLAEVVSCDLGVDIAKILAMW